MTQRPTYSSDGSAWVLAGQPAMWALQLFLADGATPQDLTDRVFAQRIYDPRDGSIADDFAGAVVQVDDADLIRGGPDGEWTGDQVLATGPALSPRRSLRHEIGEVTTAGFIPIVTGAFIIEGAGDPSTPLPGAPGGDFDGPYAVYQVSGVPGAFTVIAVTYQGSPGQSAISALIDAGELPPGSDATDFAAWLSRQSIRNALIFG